MKVKALAANLKRFYLNSLQYRRRNSVCSFAPIRIWVEPTNLCNLNCPMCPSAEAAKKVSVGYMDFELYKNIIDKQISKIYITYS